MDNCLFWIIFAHKININDEKGNYNAVGWYICQQLRTETGAEHEGSNESGDTGGVVWHDR